MKMNFIFIKRTGCCPDILHNRPEILNTLRSCRGWFNKNLTHGHFSEIIANKKCVQEWRTLMGSSDLFAKCLETEGVKYIFGIPGEETLEREDSVISSGKKFITTRNEQGAAFM